MHKYAQLNGFNHDLKLQVYMYCFMYVDPETMPAEDHFPDTETFVVSYKEISAPGTVPKHWLGFSSIRSKDYELDKNSDNISFKKNQTTHPTIKLIFTRKY